MKKATIIGRIVGSVLNPAAIPFNVAATIMEAKVEKDIARFNAENEILRQQIEKSMNEIGFNVD